MQPGRLYDAPHRSAMRHPITELYSRRVHLSAYTELSSYTELPSYDDSLSAYPELSTSTKLSSHGRVFACTTDLLSWLPGKNY